ncbi:hypothetical protein WJX81_008684 [Elliptochloris bilobata]|uniref:16S rRNA (cytosine(967)-C(5))-methyltransferase n=1 Tax=Elliptochloris bilobata TaxID=381761 RepID=A0AAW1QV29_9CHLO
MRTPYHRDRTGSGGRVLDTTRGEIVHQLLRIEAEGAFAGLVGGSPGQKVAKRRLRRKELDKRQQARVTAAVAGVTRRRRRLDWLLQQLLNRPLAKVDPRLLAILRLGLFELTMAGKAGHAMSAHVDLAALIVNKGASGMVNAVLRNAVRQLAAGTLPEPALAPATASLEARADSLGVALSHPTWLVERWLRRLGDQETAELMAANNSEPAYCLRVNRLRTTAAAFKDELCSTGAVLAESPLLPEDFLCVESGLAGLLRGAALSDGLCQVQDHAAGLVVALLNPQPGEAVLDACAAPGGKALYAAARMGGQGRLVAVDRSAARLRGLAETGRAQGLPEGFLDVRPGDLQALGEQLSAGGGFDRVLVDAPCSGTGVLTKRADLRWRRTPLDLLDLVALQAELLDIAARLVRPGGVLVYSTCSLEPEENEEQIARFLERTPGFRLQPADALGLLPPGVLTPQGYLATLPHRHAADGAFAARLLRAS